MSSVCIITTTNLLTCIYNDIPSALHWLKYNLIHGVVHCLNFIESYICQLMIDPMISFRHIMKRWSSINVSGQCICFLIKEKKIVTCKVSYFGGGDKGANLTKTSFNSTRKDMISEACNSFVSSVFLCSDMSNSSSLEPDNLPLAPSWTWIKYSLS